PRRAERAHEERRGSTPSTGQGFAIEFAELSEFSEFCRERPVRWGMSARIVRSTMVQHLLQKPRSSGGDDGARAQRGLVPASLTGVSPGAAGYIGPSS